MQRDRWKFLIDGISSERWMVDSNVRNVMRFDKFAMIQRRNSFLRATRCHRNLSMVGISIGEGANGNLKSFDRT